MSQSLAKVYLHIIFSTKNHQKFIDEPIREKLQAYMVGANSKNGSYTEEIYANPDHVHILCTLPRVITIAKLIYNIKTSSSRWMKTQGISTFGWQDGYAVFSVSPSLESSCR
ncbi:MAG: transposase [Bacteroidales bacterium]|nr:transposase [Bacteroidales bacterium]